MGVEWALVFFTLFACLAVGLFAGIVATEWTGKAAEVRERGAIAVIVLLAVSVFSSILHLGHPERMFGALGHPTSGIFTEALFIGLTGLDVIAYILSIRRGAADSTRKWIATVGMVPAVTLSFSVGYTYVMASRPAWDTLILPLCYVASAAVFGCFGFAVLLANQKVESDISLTKPTLIALAIQAVLTVAYVIHLAVAPYADASRSVSRVLAGDLAPVFWIGLVIIGLCVPVYNLTRSKLESLASARLGLLCVLVAGVAFRSLMFLLGSGVRNFFSQPLF